jgi:GT2 family glycosyltransferase
MKKSLKPSKQPLVSAIVLNWNGLKWLEKCLLSLVNQSHQQLEVIAVDNASTDDSVKFIKSRFPQIKLIVNSVDSGFASGNNLGVARAKGKYILLLNNDAWVKSNLVQACLDYIKKTGLDCIAPREALYSGELKPIYYPLMDPIGHPVFIETASSQSPFFLPGTCLFIKKDVYLKTRGLDNDFFMYSEDLDWFWRLKLMNYKFDFIPGVYVYHAGAASTGSGLKSNLFLWRNENTLNMLIKNYSPVFLLITIPLYLLINLIEIFVFLFIKPKISLAYIKSLLNVVKDLPKTLVKRKWVQSKRVVNDLAILRSMYLGFGKLWHLYNYVSKG